MGAVLRARDTLLGRELAVKVLLKGLADRPEVVRRFIEEAQIAGQLQHPGIPPVHEVGALPDGRPFIAMKLIEGRTLAELLRQRTSPAEDLPRWLGVFEVVCQTLAYAHSRGVIHRDLKPGNVMVGAFGEVQVMDWGLAKLLASRERQRPEQASSCEPAFCQGSDTPRSPWDQTQAGTALGTPAYMAPEQARGEVDRVDERADVFGLGALLCEILTGCPPFSGTVRAALRQAEQADLSGALARLDGCGADAELIALAKRCLAAEPDDRPRDAGRVAEGMTAYLESVAARLRQAELERAQAQVKAAEERKRRRLTVALAASVLLTVLLAGGGFGWWWTRRSATVHDVQAALADARTNMDKGRWPEARAALARAAGRLGEGGPRELRDRVAQAQVDVAVVAELEEVRLRQTTVKGGRFNTAAADPLYVEAFGRYGVDLAEPDRAEAVLRSSAVREALLSALQDWTVIATDDGVRQQLYRLLDQADDNDWRRRFRTLMRGKDARELRVLARGEEALQQPAAILTHLGHALWQMGLPDEAVRLLRRARRRHPGDFWVNHDLGKALLGTEKEEAVRFLTVAAALRPDSPGTQVNLGKALAEQGKLEEAVAAFRQAVALDPKYAQAHSNLGATLSRQDKLDEAIAAHRRAIALEPKFAPAHVNLGLVLAQKGKEDEAVAAFRQAIRLDPKLAAAHYNLGDLFSKQGKLSEASAAYRRAIALDPRNADAHTRLGALLTEQNRLEEGIAAYRRAILLDPKHAAAHYNLGNTLSNQGKLGEAVAAYQQAITLDPKHVLARINLGLVLHQQGQVDEAIASLRHALALDPRSAQGHYNLGVVLGTQGKADQAMACYRQAIQSDPNYAEAHCNLGLLLRIQGRLRESLQSCRRGHELGSKRPGWPHPSALWVRQGEQLLRQEEQLLEVLAGKRKPASAAERIGHARLCTLTRRYQAGARLYAEAFAADATLADDLQTGNRYQAARTAALAGCGQGDAEPLDEKERARLRRQALTWLRADLLLHGKQLERGQRADRVGVKLSLRFWQQDSALASVRDKEALARLPEPERAAWQKLWAEVAVLHRKAGAGE
jgi:serine/threonine-protein kinase